MRKAIREDKNVRWRRAGVGVAAAILLAAASIPVFAADQPSGDVITLAQFVDQALAGGPGMLLSNASLSSAQAGYTSAAQANALGLTGSAGVSQQSPLVNTDTTLYGPKSGAVSVKAGLSMTGPLGLTVNVSASHSITEDSSLDQATSMSVNAGADIWDGYPGGTGLAAARKATLSLQDTRISEDGNRRTIIYQVKQSYYSLLAQQRQIKILQSTLMQRQEEMKKTQALYDAQSANQIDLKQAQVNQRMAELDLLKAQDSMQVSREKLSALVGWPLDKAYSVDEVGDLPVPDMQLADAVKAAVAQRTDMKQLQIIQGTAAIDLALSRGKATPTVSATAGVSWSHGWTAPSDSLSLTLGLSVSGPIIDGGSAAAQAKQAELEAETVRIQQQQKTAEIATDVRDALASLRDLEARAELAKSSLELAQNVYDLTKIQFDSGVKSNLDVLTASVALTTAQVSMAKARADAQLGVLALQNALGN